MSSRSGSHGAPDTPAFVTQLRGEIETTYGQRPGHSVAGDITNSFKLHLHPSGYDWGHVPDSVKRTYWDEFQRYYQWDALEDKDMRRRYMSLASRRYSQFLYNMRKNKVKKPNSLTDVCWRSWQQSWNTTKFKEKMVLGKQNRKEGSKWTGGSMSTLKHSDKMVNETRIDPKAHAVFVETHTLKNNCSEFVDDRAREVEERYQTAISQARSQFELGGPLAPHVDEDDIFFKAAGGRRKRRVYGLGAYAEYVYPDERNNVSSPGSSRDQGAQRSVQAQLQAQQAVFDEKLAQTIASVTEQVQGEVRRQMTNEMSEHVRRLMADEMSTYFRDHGRGPLPDQHGPENPDH